MKTLSIAFILTCASSAWAATAGVNFTDLGPYPTVHMQGSTVLGIDNWVDVGPYNTTNWSSSTTLSGLTFGWTSKGGYYGGASGTQAQGLFRCYLDDPASGGTYNGKAVGVHMTISGLDAWMQTNGLIGYQVEVFYASSDTTNTPGTAYINDANSSGNLYTWTAGAVTSSGDGQFPDSTGSAGSRYIRMSDTLSADSIELFHYAKDVESGHRNGIAAVAVIGIIPEPSTYAFMGVGLVLGVIVLRRRKSK